MSHKSRVPRRYKCHSSVVNRSAASVVSSAPFYAIGATPSFAPLAVALARAWASQTPRRNPSSPCATRARCTTGAERLTRAVPPARLRSIGVPPCRVSTSQPRALALALALIAHLDARNRTRDMIDVAFTRCCARRRWRRARSDDGWGIVAARDLWKSSRGVAISTSTAALAWVLTGSAR